MSSRRTFITQAVRGAAALSAYGLSATGRVLGANNRVRIGLIGAGGRGQEIFKAALRCPDVEGVAVADVYTRRLDEVKGLVPSIKTYRDFRQLLDDKSVDAVLIATPQHQHALNFVPALQAGKDIYQEKTMAFNPDHAKRMRRALKGSGRIVQVGIQTTSGPGVEKAHEYLKPEMMGMITQLLTHHYRNEAYGGWKRNIPTDCDLQHVNWKAFEGEAKQYPFDPNRFINWRFYWDYSGGNVFENMVHQVGFWQKVLSLKIPEKVTMSGNNYYSPDMQLPDTMDVSMDHTSDKILFTWNSMFGNRLFGEGYDLVLGTKGTIFRDENENFRYAKDAEAAGLAESLKSATKAADIVGGSDATDAHMQNFFDCVRSRQQPNCPLELGFSSAIACQMAITSYRQGRTVRWDPKSEDIV